MIPNEYKITKKMIQRSKDGTKEVAKFNSKVVGKSKSARAENKIQFKLSLIQKTIEEGGAGVDVVWRGIVINGG